MSDVPLTIRVRGDAKAKQLHRSSDHPKWSTATVHPWFCQVASVRSAGSIAERVKVLTGSDKAMSGRAAHEIGIVDYPGAQAACILGLTDLFGVASAMALDQGRLAKSCFALPTG